MPHRILLPLLLSACVPLAGPAPAAGGLAVDWHGAILPDGRAIRCDVDGRTVSVVWDVTIPHRAQATLDPPLIRIRPDLGALRPGVQHFAIVHDCGHVTLQTTDEHAADCWAASHAELTPAEWRDVQDYMSAQPGGAEQWRRMQRCRAE
jgi:hypothetical protein